MIDGRCSRRRFAVGSALSALQLWLRPAESHAAEPVPGGPVLVCVFLRGAADGLSIVVPHADPEYYALRPSIAVRRPDQKGGAIDLDGRFGLHPRLSPLKSAYEAHELALIHAVGSPHPTRSHFVAQDYMETAVVGNRNATRGWLAQCLALRAAPSSDAVRALAVSARAPLALRGFNRAVVAEDLQDYHLKAAPALRPTLMRGFRRLYEGANGGLAERTGSHALAAADIVANSLASARSTQRHGRDLRDFVDVATLIRANIGLELAWIDLPGWDTHKNQGNTDGGELPRRLDYLGRALAAFRAELGPELERVVVVVMSEFGRTARQNGTFGTDHGHGNVMLVLGGKVQGGRVLGDFPGLAPEQLFEQRDVPVTTDFRDVLAEVCERHLGIADLATVFPGYPLQPGRRLGLFA